MFCGKCGAQNAEGAAFCEECGAALKKSPEGLGTAAKGGKRKDKNLLLEGAVAFAIVAALIFAAVLVNRGGKSTPEAAAENMINVLFSGDSKAFVDLLPQKLAKAMMKEGDFKNKAELAEAFSGSMDDVVELVKGSGVKLTAKAVGRSAGNVDTAALKSARKTYGEYGMEATSYAYVDVELTARVEGEKVTVPVNYVPVVMIDGSWYVDFNALDLRSVYNALYRL